MADAPLMPPPTPEQVSTFIENGRVVFRGDEATALYVYDKDQPGHSTCEGACAVTWKPVLANSDAKPIGAWTLVARKDHSKQWAYKGRPIYSYANDVPGSPKGEGVDGVWHVLEP